MCLHTRHTWGGEGGEGRGGEGMGWDGMGWDGMGWDGMGWDGMGWDGMGWDGEKEGNKTLEALSKKIPVLDLSN